jgi:hypothetical protein
MRMFILFLTMKYSMSYAKDTDKLYKTLHTVLTTFITGAAGGW